MKLNLTASIVLVILLAYICRAGLQIGDNKAVAYTFSTTPYELLPTNGLVAHWKLDEMSYNGTAGEVKDSVGINNGTSYGGLITNPGKIGRAGYFNGNNGYINYGDVCDIGSNSLSVLVWFKTSAKNYNCSLIAKSFLGTWAGRWFIIIENGVLLGFVEFSGGDQIVKTVADPYLDGRWHLVAFIINRLGSETLYVDATECSETDISAFSANDLVTSNWLFVGAYPDATGTAPWSYYFDGLIDDVRIYNRALSSNEVVQIYHARPLKESARAVYQGNRLVSNPQRKNYPKTIENYTNQ